MPALKAITVDKLVRIVGTPNAPIVIDLGQDSVQHTIPGVLRRTISTLPDWSASFVGRSVIVVCEDGGAKSQGAAAWLRQAGVDADHLEGGSRAWTKAGHPVVDQAAVPPRDAAGRTLWVTRARPKVDRIACPWLIRRFIDPTAMLLFVAAPEVLAVAGRMGATPFDVEGDGVRWSHDGERCTFDVMVDAFGLGGSDALTRLATIVRGADTGHPEAAPEAAGLLALSLGLSRMYADDLEQLDAGMLIYDALYRWCRDATGETHNWTSHVPARSKERV
jgi:rhodanese-related sulfurtransferase